jgi:hypothetical protein
VTERPTSPRRSLAETKRIYDERHKRFSNEAADLAKSSTRVENLRGLSFAVFAVGAGLYFTKGNVVAGLIGGAAFFVFAWLVQHHGKVLEQEAVKRRFSLVNEHALLRLTDGWHAFPRTGATFAPTVHGYADDLDLFGVGSVYQRLTVAHTRYGQHTLANWLSGPSPLGELCLRQEAAIEFSGHMELRQVLEAEGMALVEKKRGRAVEITDGPNPNRLLAWAMAPAKIAGRAALLTASIILPLATITGMVAHSMGALSPMFWLAPLSLSMLLLTVTKEATSETFSAVSTTEGAFLRYGSLLATLESQEFRAPWLRDRIEGLKSKAGLRPSELMRRFRTLVSWYDLRHNGMVYPFVNAILLWDIHCTRALDHWKAQAGSDLQRWFEVIGEVEALGSLAALYADDPGATMPDLIDPASAAETPRLRAVQMGHPLLSPGKRVSNDISDLVPGEGLLVTGSNMSGKSTFLRALGVNAVLAFAGGPVIAREMSLPLCRLGTSIRVSDSLRSGVSHFYAEVQKLALVVTASAQTDLPALFLLDEVLHGTNSRERQIGARWVLGELLKNGAFGVITTHDMELCRLPEHLMSHVRQHHFRESVHDGAMTFDYTLRDGPVTSGNALRLMQQVGLNVPLED